MVMCTQNDTSLHCTEKFIYKLRDLHTLLPSYPFRKNVQLSFTSELCFNQNLRYIN